MIKLTAQQCFDQACIVYENAKSIIGDLTVAAKEISPEFNGEIDLDGTIIKVALQRK